MVVSTRHTDSSALTCVSAFFFQNFSSPSVGHGNVQVLKRRALPFTAVASLPSPPVGMASFRRLMGSAPRRGILSHSIRIPDYFHFQPDTPDTPERHPHYATRMTTSINLESIITNTVGSIDFIAVASDT